MGSHCHCLSFSSFVNWLYKAQWLKGNETTCNAQIVANFISAEKWRLGLWHKGRTYTLWNKDNNKRHNYPLKIRTCPVGERSSRQGADGKEKLEVMRLRFTWWAAGVPCCIEICFLSIRFMYCMQLSKPNPSLMLRLEIAHSDDIANATIFDWVTNKISTK